MFSFYSLKGFISVVYVAGLAAAAFPAGIKAESPDPLRAVLRCAEFESSFRRLTCYDELAARLGGSSPSTGQPGRLAPTSLPDTQLGEVETALPASPEFKLPSRRDVVRPDGSKLRPQLIVECGAPPKSSIELGVVLPAGTVAVNTRVDTGEIVREVWSVGAGGEAVIVPAPERFLAALRGGRILEVKISPKRGPAIPFSFNLSQLKGGCRMGDSTGAAVSSAEGRTIQGFKSR